MTPISRLLQSFREVIASMPPDHRLHPALQSLVAIISAEQRFLSAVYSVYPQSLMQTIVNSISEKTHHTIDSGGFTLRTLSESWIRFNTDLGRPWIRIINGSPKNHYLEEFPAPVRAIAISDVANQIAIASGGTIYIETLNTRDSLFVLDGHQNARSNGIWSMEYTTDGQFLISTAERVCVWHTIDGSLSHELGKPVHQISRVAVSPTGNRVARTAGEIAEFDLKTTERIRSFSHGETVAYAPNLRFIASGTQTGQVVLFDPITGELVQELPAHSKWVCAVAFSNCGRYLATGSWDRTATVWDLDRLERIAVFKGHTDSVESVAFTKDSQYVITASNDRTVRRWCIRTEAVLDSYTHKAEVRTVAVDQSSDYIYSGGDDRYVVTMPITEMQNADSWLKDSERHSAIRHLATNTTRHLFAATSKALVTIGNAASGEYINTHHWRETLFGDFSWSHFSPDGLRIVIATSGGNIQAIDFSTGEEVQLTACFDDDAVIEMEFSLNSRFLIVSAHKELRMFRTADWQMLAHIDGRQPEDAKLEVRYERGIWVSDDGLNFGTSSKMWSWSVATDSWTGSSLAKHSASDRAESATLQCHAVVCDKHGVRVTLDTPLWLTGYPDHVARMDDTIICVRHSKISIGIIEHKKSLTS